MIHQHAHLILTYTIAYLTVCVRSDASGLFTPSVSCCGPMTRKKRTAVTVWLDVEQRQPRVRSRFNQSRRCPALLQVSQDCGFLPLALAIAGSTSTVKGHGSSMKKWKTLHENLGHRGDALSQKGDSNTSLYRVLDASFDELGTKRQRMFLRMAVLPYGAVAPKDMLQNLWEVEVSVTFGLLGESVPTTVPF